jgi:hypothetical protein
VEGVPARGRVVGVVDFAAPDDAAVVGVVVGAGVAPEDVAETMAMPTPSAPATPMLSEATTRRLREAGCGLRRGAMRATYGSRVKRVSGPG